MLSIPPALKKIMSVGLFAGVVFFGARTCSVESTECELVFRLPEGSQVSELEVRLFEEDSTELVGQFKKHYYRGETAVAAKWPLKVAAGAYRLEGEMRTHSTVVPLVQAVTLENDETIVVHLDRFLSEPNSGH